MRKAIVSVGVFALLVVGAFGCAHHGGSHDTMKMSSAMACCGDACKKMGGDCCKADDTGKATKVQAGADGSYSVSLPAGSYKGSVDSLSSSIPVTSCHTQIDSYTVLPGATSTIDFICRP